MSDEVEKFCKRQYKSQIKFNKVLSQTLSYGTSSESLIKFGQSKVSEGGVSMKNVWEVGMDPEEAAYSKEQSTNNQKKFDIISSVGSDGTNTEQSMITKLYYRLHGESGSSPAFDKYFSGNREESSVEKREVVRLASNVRYLYRFNIDLLILACRWIDLERSGVDINDFIDINDGIVDKYMAIVRSYN